MTVMNRRTVAAAALGCSAYRAFGGAVLGLSWALHAAPLLSGRPSGDASLWDGRGIWLAEVGKSLQPEGGGLAAQSLLLAVVVALGWGAALLVLAGAIAGQGDLRACARRALQRLPRLALVEGLSLLLRALVLGVVLVFAVLTLVLLDPEPPARELVLGGFVLAGLAASWMVALWQDTARLELACSDAGAFAALHGGGRLLWRGRGALLVAAGWRSLCGLALVLLATGATLAAAPATLVMTGAYLGGALALVTLRASWLVWLARRRAAS